MTSGSKSIRDAFHEASLFLSAIDSPIRESALLLAYQLGYSLSQLYLKMDEIIEAEQIEKFVALCELRLKGMPFQYITGVAEFMGLSFHVNQGVLIPRPETELLVEIGFDFLNKLKRKESNQRIKVLDMCTGSGCIAISIAKKFADCEIVASDISEDALVIARQNSKLNEVEGRIKFVQSDLFEQIEGKYDLILSNPPYLSDSDLLKLQKEVETEPEIALSAGSDGLEFYKTIARQFENYLIEEGMLALEFGIGQGEPLKKLFSKGNSKLSLPVISKDYSGIERNLMIYKNCIQ